MLFTGGPCTEGMGKIINKDLAEEIRRYSNSGTDSSSRGSASSCSGGRTGLCQQHSSSGLGSSRGGASKQVHWHLCSRSVSSSSELTSTMCMAEAAEAGGAEQRWHVLWVKRAPARVSDGSSSGCSSGCWFGCNTASLLTTSLLPTVACSHKDLAKDAAPHFRKAKKFYDGLAAEMVQHGNICDIFSCALDNVSRYWEQRSIGTGAVQPPLINAVHSP
jgi:hypothetical protein